MPQPRTTSRTALSRLLFLAVLGWALVALGRRTSEETEGTFAAAEPAHRPAASSRSRLRARPRAHAEEEARHEPRVRNPLFAGAASAGAGDMLVGSMEPSAARATRPRPPRRRPMIRPPATRHPPRSRPRLPPRSPRRPRRRPTTARRPPRAASPASRPTPATPPIPVTASSRRDDRPRRRARRGSRRRRLPVRPRRRRPRVAARRRRRRSARSEGPARRRSALPRDDEQTGQLDPEAGMFGGATVAPPDAPDPTPARAATRAPLGEDAPHRVECRRLMGPRPRRGSRERPHRPHSRHPGDRPVAGPPPRGDRRARRVELVPRALGPHKLGRPGQAFARYNRAVGLHALVVGLDASKRTLERKVLNGRLSIYPGGRSDVAGHGVDVRVLVLLRYLAEARPPARRASTPATGTTAGPAWSRRIRTASRSTSPRWAEADLRPLPAGRRHRGRCATCSCSRPSSGRGRSSRLGLGGPSFPLADHDDHIHVGF